MKETDLYGILQISKDATQEDIKKAYRKLALQYHPDKNKGDKLCEEKFKTINEAYSTLSDPHKKEAYDKTLRIQKKDIRFDFFFGNLFNQFFDPDYQNRKTEEGDKRGLDVTETLDLTEQEFLDGCVKDLKYGRPSVCGVCEGKGTLNVSRKEQCDVCRGKGKMNIDRGIVLTTHPCKRCLGRGVLEYFECAKCNSEGIIRKESTIKLKIPTGTNPGDVLKCVGRGGPGVGLGQNGDLFVTLKLIK